MDGRQNVEEEIYNTLYGSGNIETLIEPRVFIKIYPTLPAAS